VKFLVYAQSSCAETNEWLVYIQDIYEDLASEAKELLNEVDGLGRQLNMFIQPVEARTQPPEPRTQNLEL
jgi:four helix bundle protein